MVNNMTKFQEVKTRLKVRSELRKMPKEVIHIMYEELKNYLSRNNISKEVK